MNKNYKIDNTIYQIEYIENAIEAFSDIADIQHNKGELIISGDDNDTIELIFCEFMNFIIGLINE